MSGAARAHRPHITQCLTQCLRMLYAAPAAPRDRGAKNSLLGVTMNSSRIFRRDQHDAIMRGCYMLYNNNKCSYLTCPLLHETAVLRQTAACRSCAGATVIPALAQPSGNASPPKPTTSNARGPEQAQRSYDRSRQEPAHWPTGAL